MKFKVSNHNEATNSVKNSVRTQPILDLLTLLLLREDDERIAIWTVICHLLKTAIFYNVYRIQVYRSCSLSRRDGLLK